MRVLHRATVLTAAFSFFFLTLFLMDNIQIWLYVIIGAVYLLSRLRKVQSKTPAKPPVRRDVKTESPSVKPVQNIPKGLTFEELLREITESKSQPAQEPVVDYDEQIGAEEEDLEDVNYDHRKDNKVVDTYEEAKRQAFLRPSLEETMNVQNTDVSFGKFKEFDNKEEARLAAMLLKDFADPDGLKRAVIMSEILKTKF